MSFRVTQGMMTNQLMRNLNNNMVKIDKYQNQLSTGRKLNKPSDDPVGITYSLRYRSELSSNEQYSKNANMTTSWLDFTDTVLGQTSDAVLHLRELAIKGATGTNPQSAMDAIKNEVDELKSQLVDIANSQLNGQYIFNGQLTNIPPYSLNNPAQSVTDIYDINLDLGSGMQIPINIVGNRVFGLDTDPDNLFKILDDMSQALKISDYAKVNDLITDVDSRLETILGIRSEVGARNNRVEMITNRLGDLNLNIQTLQSKVEDADLAEVTMQAKVSESVYQASLSTGAKIIQPSLVDFLR